MLANYFEVDPAVVSRMLDTLERNGFLLRSEDQADRRADRVQLTEAGRRASKLWQERCRAMEQAMLRGFTDAERRAVCRLPFPRTSKPETSAEERGGISLSVLKRLGGYLGPYRRDLLLAALLVLVETAAELFIPVLMAAIIDEGVAARNVSLILHQGILMAVCALVSLGSGLLHARVRRQGLLRPRRAAAGGGI